MAKQRIFVDIDGTLAKWQSVETFEELITPGFYASMQPNTSVVEAVQIIMDDPEYEVFTISAYLPEAADAVGEKNAWLDKFLPGLDREHRFFCLCGEDKSAVIPNGIRKDDILLDDYTFNLRNWARSGTALKLMNGVNGTKGTWTGQRVSMFTSARHLADKIKSISKGAVV